MKKTIKTAMLGMAVLSTMLGSAASVSADELWRSEGELRQIYGSWLSAHNVPIIDVPGQKYDEYADVNEDGVYELIANAEATLYIIAYNPADYSLIPIMQVPTGKAKPNLSYSPNGSAGHEAIVGTASTGGGIYYKYYLDGYTATLTDVYELANRKGGNITQHNGVDISVEEAMQFVDYINSSAYYHAFVE